MEILEQENTTLQNLLWLAWEEIVRREGILEDNLRLETQLRAANRKLNKIEEAFR